MFQRTTCDCQQCKTCCTEQPGHLLPGQMEQIAEYLKLSWAEVKKLFWASPGALLHDTARNRQFRVGTITPRFDRRKKACVFLTEEGLCGIHEVAPFGCSHFDTHMSKQEAHKRSMWGIQYILSDTDYGILRKSLPFAESYKPKGY